MPLVIGERRDICCGFRWKKKRKRVEKLEKYSDTSISFYQGLFVVLLYYDPKDHLLFGAKPSQVLFLLGKDFFYQKHS